MKKHGILTSTQREMMTKDYTLPSTPRELEEMVKKHCMLPSTLREFEEMVKRDHILPSTFRPYSHQAATIVFYSSVSGGSLWRPL